MSFVDKVIIVNPYISSRVYDLGTPSSRSYVVNERLQSEFLFEGLVSDLWNIILLFKENGLSEEDYENSEPVKKLNEFIVENSLQDEFEIFLDELYYSDLITYGSCDDLYEDILLQNTKLTLHNEPAEIIEFLNEKKKYLFNNKYLYSLTFKYSENFDAEMAIDVLNDAIEIGVNVVRIDVRGSVLGPDFVAFVKQIREKYMSFELIVDGDSLIKEHFLCRKIVNLYPHRVIIPLYSMDENIHDSIVGRAGDFNSSIKTIEKLVAESIPVNVYFEEKEKNKSSLESVLEYTNCMGIEISLDKKNSSDLPIFNLVNDDYLEANDNVDEMFYARQKLYVSEKFDLCLNSEFSQTIASLKECSIIEIWNNIILDNKERK